MDKIFHYYYYYKKRILTVVLNCGKKNSISEIFPSTYKYPVWFLPRMIEIRRRKG